MKYLTKDIVFRYRFPERAQQFGLAKKSRTTYFFAGAIRPKKTSASYIVSGFSARWKVERLISELQAKANK
jgi:hypothetical protein